jgi:hypothetical protein
MSAALRKAAELALDALEDAARHTGWEYAATEELRAALATTPAPAESDLIAALREIVAINDEDQGTFRKRGGTRRGLSMVVAHEAIAKATGEQP